MSFAFIAVVAVPSVQAQALSAADQAALRKLDTDFMAAWAKGDIKAMAAQYTVDVVRISPSGEVGVGRAALEKEMVSWFAGSAKGTTLRVMSAYRALKPDVVVAYGPFEVRKGTEVVEVGRSSAVFLKSASGWRIAYETSTEVPEVAPPAAQAKRKP